MKEFTYTLAADGSGDVSLMPIIDWLLGNAPRTRLIQLRGTFAYPSEIVTAEPGLKGRVEAAIEAFPCDILFVHRDAESESVFKRVNEIETAMNAFPAQAYVPVVPSRMTEAWMLIDEHAIRMAAGNPNGECQLELPPVQRLESLPDPKHTLNELLSSASEFSGRRLKKFRRDSELAWRRGRVSQLIRDFSALRRLPAFTLFEEKVLHALSVLK